MTKKQLRALRTYRDALIHVRKLNVADGPLGPLIVELEDAIAGIEERALAQSRARSLRGTSSSNVKRLRRAIRKGYMIPIRRRAKTLLRNLPGLTAALRVPHAKKSTAVLVAAAHAMAKAVQPYASEFRKARFPKDFLTRLRSDARELAKGAAGVTTGSRQLTQATVDLARAFRHARDTEEAIDGLLLARFDEGVASAAEWRSARRIGKPRGRPRKKRGLPEA